MKSARNNQKISGSVLVTAPNLKTARVLARGRRCQQKVDYLGQLIQNRISFCAGQNRIGPQEVLAGAGNNATD